MPGTMPGTIFWDVDTQYDFIMPGGKLYVQDAEKILPNLRALTCAARRKNIPIYGSVDSHSPDDPELSDAPDFEQTFPPHCIEGTPGQEKVPETQPENPLWIDPGPVDARTLVQNVLNHTGEVFFRKKQFDVFSNPNVEPALNAIRPGRIVLYGVTLDICDAHAIEGFLKRRTAPIDLVLDATQPIDPEQGRKLVEKWKSQGVRIVTTEEIVAQP